MPIWSLRVWGVISSREGRVCVVCFGQITLSQVKYWITYGFKRFWILATCVLPNSPVFLRFLDWPFLSHLDFWSQAILYCTGRGYSGHRSAILYSRSTPAGNWPWSSISFYPLIVIHCTGQLFTFLGTHALCRVFVSFLLLFCTHLKEIVVCAGNYSTCSIFVTAGTNDAKPLKCSRHTGVCC